MRATLVFIGIILLFVGGAKSQTTNSLSDAEIKGQQLAREILQQTPATNLMEKGTLRIRNSNGATTEIPVTFSTGFASAGFPMTEYSVILTNDHISLRLVIAHRDGQSNEYVIIRKRFDLTEMRSSLAQGMQLDNAGIIVPFAGSDFWIADLGLEFFHWPEQKIIKHQERRTRECTVLESTNPDPSAGGYSRVDSWVDDETLGIVHAEAYDAKGKLLKVFDPKSFKKVNGQWELQDMEIRNVQTGSRTWIKFDLNNKS
jgi:hypothetical protein